MCMSTATARGGEGGSRHTGLWAGFYVGNTPITVKNLSATAREEKREAFTNHLINEMIILIVVWNKDCSLLENSLKLSLSLYKELLFFSKGSVSRDFRPPVLL